MICWVAFELIPGEKSLYIQIPIDTLVLNITEDPNILFRDDARVFRFSIKQIYLEIQKKHIYMIILLLILQNH